MGDTCTLAVTARTEGRMSQPTYDLCFETLTANEDSTPPHVCGFMDMT